LRVSVNISAVQFRQADFADTVDRALGVSGLDARYLELEVTESAGVPAQQAAAAAGLCGAAGAGTRIA